MRCSIFLLILSTHNINHIDLLKFDVEGSEYKLFQGLKEKSKVSYVAGELHKDLIPEGFDEFMSEFTLDFDIIKGGDLINNDAKRKPVVLAKGKKS